MTWLMLLIAAAAVVALALFFFERRYEKRSVDDAQRELDRVQHRIDTMTVELEPPAETPVEDRYLDDGGRTPKKSDSSAAPRGPSP